MLYSWETNGEYAPRWSCDNCSKIFPIPWGTKADRIKSTIQLRKKMMCSTECIQHRGVQPRIVSPIKDISKIKVLPPFVIGRTVKKKGVAFVVEKHLDCTRNGCSGTAEYRKITQGKKNDYTYCQTCKLYIPVDK